MFFDEDRIRAVREMILADDEKTRRTALAKLLPMQRNDFIELFEIMGGLPVTIRLLDPPLHEFLPPTDEVLAQFPSANLITNFAPARMSRDDLYVGAKWLISKLMDPDNFYVRLEAMSELLAPPPWQRRGKR